MKRWSLIGLVAAAALGLSACGGGDGGGGGDGTAMAGKATCIAEAGSGVLCMKATAADGVTPLVGAEVTLSEAAANEAAKLASKGVADPTRCITDDEGNAACIVPSNFVGARGFIISFPGFANKSFTATIVIDDVVDAGTQSMTGDASAKWVVVPGSFDGVQVLLSQLKACTLKDAVGNDFDPSTEDAAGARWSQDCEDKGLLVLDASDTTSTRYVPDFLKSADLNNYSALFVNCASDYSGDQTIDDAIQAFNAAGKHIYFSDLSDSWLEAAFPGKITFGPHSTSTGTVSASVVHTGLKDFVGDPINIIFDLGGWADIDTVTSDVTVFIQGDISPLSSLAGVHPITVGWRPATASGCIFYTSYHIEGASTGSDQEKAIKYLVQNIASVCQ